MKADLDAIFSLGLALPDVCRRAEERLLEGIPDVIQEAVSPNARGSGAVALEPRFAYEDVVYECRVRESANDASGLVVAIGEATTRWPSAEFVRVEASLDSAGLYTSVLIEVDPRLGQIADSLSGAVQSYLQDGYRQLDGHVVSELLVVEHRVVIDLYIEVRSVLDEAVASHVGLYGLLDDGRALYLLDPLAIQAALSQLTTERPTISASPVALVSTLVKGWVRTEDTIASKALEADHPIDFRLQDLKYTTTPGYDVAEGGLYAASDLICQPLVREGPVRLIAAYPVSLRDLAEPKLDGLRPRFAQILGDRAVSTKKLVQGDPSGTGQHWNVDRFAQVLGRFTGGFTESPQ